MAPASTQARGGQGAASARALASVPPEVKTSLRPARRPAATCARARLQRRPRGAAEAVDRGRIAGQVQRPRHGRPQLPAAPARWRCSRDKRRVSWRGRDASTAESAAGVRRARRGTLLADDRVGTASAVAARADSPPSCSTRACRRDTWSSSPSMARATGVGGVVGRRAVGAELLARAVRHDDLRRDADDR